MVYLLVRTSLFSVGKRNIFSQTLLLFPTSLPTPPATDIEKNMRFTFAAVKAPKNTVMQKTMVRLAANRSFLVLQRTSFVRDDHLGRLLCR